ncbi:MAG: indole-3-glycerol phosphate synthase TrpC [Candidatus Margulisbacteria bacterium]|nr:indole-3-glycerol phosphate synthase TrpC [Candidatus Margulisiibacteriota bacterium]
MPDILDDIVFNKRQEVTALKVRLDVKKSGFLPVLRDFRKALLAGQPAIIAEVKKASPSAGVLVSKYFPAKIARIYEMAGAAAISVLTDEKYFKGGLADLTAVKKAVKLPVLRKDFIIDESQIYESRLAGADAILLIVRILTDEQLSAFLTTARQLKMAALVEVHNEREVERALAAGAEIIGINNRDLGTLKVDVKHTIHLLDKFPELRKKLVVSESGIRSAVEVKELRAAGVKALLVGEGLLKSRDPAAKLKELMQFEN